VVDDSNTRILSDPQDPLPEGNWTWRRIFTFVVAGCTFAILVGLGYAVNRIVSNIVERIDTIDAVNLAKITVVALNVLLAMFKMMFYVVIVNMILYIVAPSAEQITKMIKTASLLKSGVQIASRAIARSDGSEETQAAVGQPPQPVVPPDTAGPEVTSDEEDFAPRSTT
jgi:hypothetical protein